MRVDFPYGDETRGLIVPSGASVEYITPADLAVHPDVSDALERACAEPVESKPLDALVGAGASVLIIIADLTRSPATAEMLPAAVNRLVASGVGRDGIRVLVARGTHRSLTREEKRFFREGALKGLAVIEHDCDDHASLSALMLTRHGTPVRIHRAVREADLVLLLSPISFHYFAGFGGGRKLILPGCADRDAILANHRLCLRDTRPVSLHPSCRPGNLEGNPVHDDMVEPVRAMSHLFAVNFFTGIDGGVAFVNAGDTVASHEEACAAYAASFRVDISAPVKVAVAGAGGWPYDINLLQAHKSLFHAAAAVEEGGSILLLAHCGEGVGSESLAAALAMERDAFFARAYEHYALNNQAGVSLLGLTEKYRVAMVTELGDEVLENAGIQRCGNAEAWVAEALEKQGTERIAVVKHGGCTLPRVKE